MLEIIVKTICEALDAGTLQSHIRETLKGQLRYARAQCFATCGAEQLRALGSDKWDVVRPALEWWRQYLATAAPRLIPLEPVKSYPRLFLDGACEEGQCGTSIGGVLVIPGKKVQAFHHVVPWALVEKWKAETQGKGDPSRTQVIGQAEIAPVQIALMTWAQLLRGKHVAIFIDNDAARLGLVKGYSPSLASARLIGTVHLMLAELAIFAWFARVPTLSNVADGPSRGMIPVAFDNVAAVVPDEWKVNASACLEVGL